MTINVIFCVNNQKTLLKKIIAELLEEHTEQFMVYTNHKAKTDGMHAIARDAVYESENYSEYLSSLNGDSFKEGELFAINKLQ